MPASIARLSSAEPGTNLENQGRFWATFSDFIELRGSERLGAPPYVELGRPADGGAGIRSGSRMEKSEIRWPYRLLSNVNKK